MLSIQRTKLFHCQFSLWQSSYKRITLKFLDKLWCHLTRWKLMFFIDILFCLYFLFLKTKGLLYDNNMFILWYAVNYLVNDFICRFFLRILMLFSPLDSPQYIFHKKYFYDIPESDRWLCGLVINYRKRDENINLSIIKNFVIIMKKKLKCTKIIYNNKLDKGFQQKWKHFWINLYRILNRRWIGE